MRAFAQFSFSHPHFRILRRNFPIHSAPAFQPLSLIPQWGQKISLFLLHWRSLSSCSLSTFYRLVHIFCWQPMRYRGKEKWLVSNQWCKFLSQDMRENRAFFCSFAARVSPSFCDTFTRDFQIISQNTPLSTHTCTFYWLVHVEVLEQVTHTKLSPVYPAKTTKDVGPFGSEFFQFGSRVVCVAVPRVLLQGLLWNVVELW